MAEAQNYVVSTGLIIPDTSATLEGVQSEWKEAFGSDLSLDPSTSQGIMISAETSARNTFLNNNATLANSINPNYAGGVLLDAILALTGVQRQTQTKTQVLDVTVSGVPGTTIPQGVQAETSAGDLFESTATVVIPAGGSTTVNFQSVAYGAIPCAISALTTIVTAVLGWETVTNSAAGTVGTTTQSDQVARAYRKNTLAFQGKSLAEAITSAIYAVPGVTSLYFQENVSATTQTINGISMVGHSVYACVAGGDATDIAAALLENKSSGGDWNGGTTVSLVEPASGQTYDVKFDVSTPVGILIKATVHGATETQVQAAILDYAAGTVSDPSGNSSNLKGFVVGSDVSPYEIASAISIENPGCYVSSLTISYESPVSYVTTPLAIAVSEIAFTQRSFLTVTIN